MRREFRRFKPALASLLGLLRELDNQDGVLCCQSDQHHQADLDQDVAIQPTMLTPIIAAKMHIGTINTTARGNSQLS